MLKIWNMEDEELNIFCLPICPVCLPVYSICLLFVVYICRSSTLFALWIDLICGSSWGKVGGGSRGNWVFHYDLTTPMADHISQAQTQPQHGQVSTETRPLH